MTTDSSAYVSVAAFIFSTMVGVVLQRKKSQLEQLNNDERQRQAKSRLVRFLSNQSNWSDYNDDNEIFIQDMPKVELHVHLDGTFDPDFLWKYMKENPQSVYCLPIQTTPPWEDPPKELKIRSMVQSCETARDYHHLCTCRGYRSLKQMFNCFEVFLPLITGNLQLIEQLAFDFCQRQYEQNCVYCEVRYSPHLLAEGFGAGEAAHWDTSENINNGSCPVTAESVFLAVRKGLQRGCEHFPTLRVNQILCAINWRPDWALSTLELAKKYIRDDGLCGVVGIDIAAGEEHFDSETFPKLHEAHYQMAQMAKEHQIPMTIHAGEAGEHALENVRKAVTDYGAVRIGHGYRMTDSADVMKLVRDLGVHVETCPTSSDETGGWVYSLEEGGRNWKKHPTVTMLKRGISISLSSDDPAVFHTSLAWQYRIALAKMELSQEELLQMNLNGVEAAWCTEREKKRLRRLIRFYGISQGVEVKPEEAQHVDDDNVHTPHVWSRSKTDSFLDRVYINSEWQV